MIPLQKLLNSYYAKKKNLELNKIILSIDAWFDVCNSRLKFCLKIMKCALGVHESE